MAGEEPLLLAAVIKCFITSTPAEIRSIVAAETPELRHPWQHTVIASKQENVQLMAGRETVDAHGWHAQ